MAVSAHSGFFEAMRWHEAGRKSTFFSFETNSYSIALTGLGLDMQTRVALKSQKPVCLCLPSAATKGIQHHTQMISTFKRCTIEAGEMDKS